MCYNNRMITNLNRRIKLLNENRMLQLRSINTLEDAILIYYLRSQSNAQYKIRQKRHSSIVLNKGNISKINKLELQRLLNVCSIRTMKVHYNKTNLISLSEFKNDIIKESFWMKFKNIVKSIYFNCNRKESVNNILEFNIDEKKCS